MFATAFAMHKIDILLVFFMATEKLLSYVTFHPVIDMHMYVVSSHKDNIEVKFSSNFAVHLNLHSHLSWYLLASKI